MKPVMNAARMKECMQRGGTREQCMKEVYPEKSGGAGKKSSKKSSKKAPPAKSGRPY
jgi:hypothetical protein